jgi:hypothetical protein
MGTRGKAASPSWTSAQRQLGVEPLRLDLDQVSEIGLASRVQCVEAVHHFAGDVLAQRLVEPL